MCDRFYISFDLCSIVPIFKLSSAWILKSHWHSSTLPFVVDCPRHHVGDNFQLTSLYLTYVTMIASNWPYYQYFRHRWSFKSNGTRNFPVHTKIYTSTYLHILPPNFASLSFRQSEATDSSQEVHWLQVITTWQAYDKGDTKLFHLLYGRNRPVLGVTSELTLSCRWEFVKN